MFTNFKEAFITDDKGITNSIPKEILEVLSDNLPQNLKYTEIRDGVIAVTTDHSSMNLSGFSLETPNGFPKEIPSTSRNILEYMYRSQTETKIKPHEEGCILVDNAKVLISELVMQPLVDVEFTENTLIIKPSPFAPPTSITVKVGELKKDMFFRRMPHNSMDILKFENIDHKHLHFSYLLNEKTKDFTVKFNINIEETTDLEQYIECLKFLYGFQNEGVEIAGFLISNNNPKKEQVTSIKETLRLMEKVMELSILLDVTFDYKKPLQDDDVYTIENLYGSLVHKQPFIKDVHLNSLSFNTDSPAAYKHMEESEGLAFQYADEEVLNVLGTSLKVQKIEGLFNLRVKEVLYDEEQMTCELKTEPPSEGKTYISTLYVMDIKEMEKFPMERIMEALQNGEAI